MEIARVMISKKCNFKCSYCCNENQELLDNLGIHFEPIEYSEFISKINKHDIHGINITGGEPMLNPKIIYDILHEFNGTSKSIRLYTNGSLLTRGHIDGFKKLGIDKFEIGLHTYGSVGKDVIDCAKEDPKLFRFSVNTDSIKHFDFLDELENAGCEINKWSMDECSNDDDYRFILK